MTISIKFFKDFQVMFPKIPPGVVTKDISKKISGLLPRVTPAILPMISTDIYLKMSVELLSMIFLGILPRILLGIPS